jgi:hypothetical protein
MIPNKHHIHVETTNFKKIQKFEFKKMKKLEIYGRIVTSKRVEI